MNLPRRNLHLNYAHVYDSDLHVFTVPILLVLTPRLPSALYVRLMIPQNVSPFPLHLYSYLARIHNPYLGRSVFLPVPCSLNNTAQIPSLTSEPVTGSRSHSSAPLSPRSIHSYAYASLGYSTPPQKVNLMLAVLPKQDRNVLRRSYDSGWAC